MQRSWFRLLFTPCDSSHSEALDTLAFELMDLGAGGTNITDDTAVACFFQGTDEQVEQFIGSLPPERGSLVSRSVVQDENWNLLCKEMWEPVTAGRFRIYPVQSADTPTPSEPFAIRTIPGQGFGTGHHPTTRMVLEELSNLADENDLKPSRIFDVGTGSGILAVAAAKIYESPVDANEIEEEAIANARENAAMNGVEGLISFSLDPLHAYKDSYNLILANIYGEILVSLCGEITRLAAPGAQLIVSGITELVSGSVIESYSTSGSWKLLKEREEEGWLCLRFVRLLKEPR